MIKRVHLVISGKVHGVSFRDFVRKEAEKADVVGFVANLPSGAVEVVAEGEEATLKKFVIECKRGSFLSRVERVEERREQPTGEFEDFEARL